MVKLHLHSGAVADVPDEQVERFVANGWTPVEEKPKSKPGPKPKADK